MTPIDAWDFGCPVRVEPHEGGLINLTWAVRTDGGVLAYLQRLNTAVFGPEVHFDIQAVTSRLRERGLETPVLVPTRTGALWHEVDGAVWRCTTPVGTRTIHRVGDVAEAASAGRLVARFHAALVDLPWEFRSRRAGVHDTPRHMERLAEVLETHRGHRLYDRVAPIAERVLDAWAAHEGVATLPARVIHGDLKISNVRFRGPEAVALIDLDTLARGTLDVELGDALRSWCNPATEDAPDARFDLDVFEAAMQGYASAAEGTDAAEWESVVPGVERIALELAARFAHDALAEVYFGWDPARFPTRGDHNLARAAAQATLAASVRARRAEAEAALRRCRRTAPPAG